MNPEWDTMIEIFTLDYTQVILFLLYLRWVLDATLLKIMECYDVYFSLLKWYNVWSFNILVLNFNNFSFVDYPIVRCSRSR